MSLSEAPSGHGRIQTIAIFAALVAGIAVGQWFHDPAAGAASVGGGWLLAGELLLLRPLQMIVIPLVMVAVIHGISSIGDPKRLGMLGLCMMRAGGVETFLAVEGHVQQPEAVKAGHEHADHHRPVGVGIDPVAAVNGMVGGFDDGVFRIEA